MGSCVRLWINDGALVSSVWGLVREAFCPSPCLKITRNSRGPRRGCSTCVPQDGGDGDPAAGRCPRGAAAGVEGGARGACAGGLGARGVCDDPHGPGGAAEQAASGEEAEI